jgi:hypothetical protein
MKSLYVCEKCSKSFESYQAAYQCEESHISEFEIVASEYRYLTGEILPTEIILCNKRYDWNLDSYTYTYYTASKLTPVKGKQLEGLQYNQMLEAAYSENSTFDWKKERQARETTQAADKQ